MERSGVLIIDCNPANKLGRVLYDLLCRSAGERLDLRYETVPAVPDGSSEADPVWPEGIADAALLFIVPGKAHLDCGSLPLPVQAGGQAAPPVILVIEGCMPDEVTECFRRGVSDFLTPPLRTIDVLPRMWRLLEHSRQRGTVIQSMKARLGLEQLIGRNPFFVQALGMIPVVAQSDVSVLISGDTGTGKELCARAIHYLGPRADKPFLPVNCGAVPAELVENELFGHVRGAFTGATLCHRGLIAEANGGTLFLDEIDCLPLPAQIKLLRLLQEKEYRQLGSAKTRQADVRIIAATNVDLRQAMGAGTFRQDLYYRLSIVQLALPALRDRKDDLPILARHFLEKSAAETGKDVKDFAPETIQRLFGYDWPGNVRELENVVHRAVLFSKGCMVDDEQVILPQTETTMQRESFRAEKARIIAGFEKRYMQRLLETHRGNITKAAVAAQKNRRAFWELIRKYHIDVRRYKSSAH